MTAAAQLDRKPERAPATLVQRTCACGTSETCDECGPAEEEAAVPQLQRAAVSPGGSAFPGGDTRAFMAQLRSSVTALANQELAEVGRSADQCPYIQRWLAHYERRDATHLQRAIQRYAQPNEQSTTAYHEAILSRVRGALRVWKSTGQLSGIPDEALDVDAAPSTLASMLGAGRPLDGVLRSKLEAAYGSDLGHVRVHTDGHAPGMAQGMSALAFTAGNNIAFAPGMYRPGSAAGDALIAHEVAHTIQQGGIEHPGNAIDGATEARLEREADAAAAGALGMAGGMRPRPHSALTLQRCDLPDCTPVAQSGLRLDIEAKRRCGLLDAPLRPPGVGDFPEYRYEDDLGNRPLPEGCPTPMPEMAAAAQPGGTAVLGKFLVQRQEFPIPPELAGPRPFPMPPPIEVPPLPPPPLPPPPLPPIELPPVNPAPPIPPPTPWVPPNLPPLPPVYPAPAPAQPRPMPGTRPDDARYLERLSPEQLEYYRWLRDAEQLAPEAGEDADDALPDVCPTPEPNPDDDEETQRPCVSYATARRGGHVEHDTYATLKSGSTRDYYVRTPAGLDINYDGKTPRRRVVWEVKVRHGWCFNCNYRSLRDRVLARWDAQKDRGLAVGAACEYTHIWACKNRWVADLLRNRWGGTPPVVT